MKEKVNKIWKGFRRGSGFYYTGPRFGRNICIENRWSGVVCNITPCIWASYQHISFSFLFWVLTLGYVPERKRRYGY